MTQLDDCPLRFPPISIGALIEGRAATDFFDSGYHLADSEIARLADLATRAPTAFNLQNWRLYAVRSSEGKANLAAASWGQQKIEDASVTFVVCGEIAAAADIPQRLEPSVGAGIMSEQGAEAWADMARRLYADPCRARDEALRSAILLGTTLMFAAEGAGLATSPMTGFDGARVREMLRLPDIVHPFLLVAVGRATSPQRRQKPRRPISQILTLV